jgi:hypothetical protein
MSYRAKSWATTEPELPPTCPKCGTPTEGGFGLAGGGYGPYVYCPADGCGYFAKQYLVAAGLTITYGQLLDAARNDLALNEWWVIDHDEGPLWDTKSKWITVPVKIFCEAMECDWDDAQASGYRLNKLTGPKP